MKVGTVVRVSSHAHTDHATAATASVSLRYAGRSHLGHPRESSRTRGGPRGHRPRGPDEVWCLGDIVGYGPRPNECVDLVRERSTLRSAATTTSPCSARSTSPSSAATRPRPRAGRAACSAPERALARGARTRREAAPERELFHGSPRDPVWDYVLSEEVARREPARDDRAARARRPQPRGPRARLGRRATRRRARAGGDGGELRRRRWLLNPGSVGQPRDGDARAAWLLIDTRQAGEPSGESRIQSTRRRPRSGSGAFPRRSRPGSRTASRRRGLNHRWRS